MPDIPPILGEIGYGYTVSAVHVIKCLKESPDGQFLSGFVTGLTSEWFPGPMDYSELP